jgi:hypothetical protein
VTGSAVPCLYSTGKWALSSQSWPALPDLTISATSSWLAYVKRTIILFVYSLYLDLVASTTAFRKSEASLTACKRGRAKGEKAPPERGVTSGQ